MFEKSKAVRNGRYIGGGKRQSDEFGHNEAENHSFGRKYSSPFGKGV